MLQYDVVGSDEMKYMQDKVRIIEKTWRLERKKVESILEFQPNIK